MKEFSFEILVCAQHAKTAAYESAGYTYAMLDTMPEYKTRTSPWHNLKELLSLLLPEPPWSGPPLSHCFGITWGVVRDLLSGNIGIACVHLKGKDSENITKVRPVSSKRSLESLGRQLESGRQRFLASLPEEQLKELQKFEQTEVAAFMRDREERILKAYKAGHKQP